MICLCDYTLNPLCPRHGDPRDTSIKELPNADTDSDPARDTRASAPDHLAAHSAPWSDFLHSLTPEARNRATSALVTSADSDERCEGLQAMARRLERRGSYGVHDSDDERVKAVRWAGCLMRLSTKSRPLDYWLDALEDFAGEDFRAMVEDVLTTWSVPR